MQFIKFTETESEQWDSYLCQIKGSTFNYTAAKINFDVEYSTVMLLNESVICLVDKKPVVVVLLYVEHPKENEYSISWSNSYVPVPIVDQKLSYRHQEKYLEQALEYVEKTAKNLQCSSVKFRFDPLSNPESREKLYSYNYLIKKFYLDKSSLTQILDLQKEETELWSDIRKGHKSDIKRGNYEIEFYDKTNMSQNIIEEYKKIYELDAGKVTRNSQMYQHYYNFVVDEKAIIALAKKNGENVAVLIATFYKDTAYYSSYAELTEKLSGIPVGHQLQWNTMLELKRRGIHYYEIGEQVFGSYEKGTEEAKLVNISNFKRGFGGYTVPFFRGVKYLNID